jgi:hypothetical protein
MNPENNIWKTLTVDFNEKIREVLFQQHQAAQFIALAGKHLISQQPDYSNTNMLYNYDHDMLTSNELPGGSHLCLHLTKPILCVSDKNFNCIHEILYEGKSKQQVFEEVKATLADSGLDVSGLSNELHYDLPEHPIDRGAVFTKTDVKYFIENTYYRRNADIVMNTIANENDNAGQVRVWAHHFDTGSFIPIAYNDKDELTQSIGIGWAMPDGMVNEPYYYLSFWSKESNARMQDLPLLHSGQWMMPDWDGAVLKHSEIIQLKSSEEQYKMVLSFFRSGINILTKYFKS